MISVIHCMIKILRMEGEKEKGNNEKYREKNFEFPLDQRSNVDIVESIHSHNTTPFIRHQTLRIQQQHSQSEKCH